MPTRGSIGAPTSSLLAVRPSEPPATDQILLGENLELLPSFRDGSFQLVYIDPPFNTGHAQVRKTLSVVPDDDGERIGFQGRRYRTRLLAESSYGDSFDDYLGFLAPRLEEARRLLCEEGTLYFHIDCREGTTASCCSMRSWSRVLSQRADLGI